MSEHDSRYIRLWQRMNRVVQAYTERGREEEADYFVADFFMTFEDANELERHVEIAEQSAHDDGLL